MLDPKDGGYKSRKLHLVYAGIAAVVGVGILFAMKIPAGISPVDASRHLTDIYNTLTSSVLWLVGIYASINVGGKFVIGKALKGANVPPQEDTPEESPSPDEPSAPEPKK